MNKISTTAVHPSGEAALAVLRDEWRAVRATKECIARDAELSRIERLAKAINLLIERGMA